MTAAPAMDEVERLQNRLSALEQERKHLLAVIEILQEISGTLHFADIVQSVALRLGETFGLDRCSIFLAERGGRRQGILRIEAGVRIFGATAEYLVVTRGSQIFAQGTASNPIPPSERINSILPPRVIRALRIALPLGLIAALRVMTPAERARVDELFSNDDPGEEEISEVIRIVTVNGGLDYARARGAVYAGQAREALAGLPDTVARRALLDSISYVMERHA